KEKILISSNAELALAFDIGKTTVTDILNQKERWLEVDPESFGANKKKRRSLLYENIDQAMAIWVEQAIDACLDIN
ncbi:200_t:CDS:1, partial [Entrophospora sp. SA101]